MQLNIRSESFIHISSDPFLFIAKLLKKKMPNNHCLYILPSKSLHVYWEDLSAASDPVFLLEDATGIVSSFTVFSEMQFTSCPVYCAPSSSPLMVSPHLHDLESEGILCLFFLTSRCTFLPSYVKHEYAHTEEDAII